MKARKRRSREPDAQFHREFLALTSCVLRNKIHASQKALQKLMRAEKEFSSLIYASESGRLILLIKSLLSHLRGFGLTFRIRRQHLLPEIMSLTRAKIPFRAVLEPPCVLESDSLVAVQMPRR